MNATLRRLGRFLWNDLFIGLPMPQVNPEAALDPLYCDYRVRCELARRGWRVDHLLPEHEDGTPNNNESTRKNPNQ